MPDPAISEQEKIVAWAYDILTTSKGTGAFRGAVEEVVATALRVGYYRGEEDYAASIPRKVPPMEDWMRDDGWDRSIHGPYSDW